VIENQSTLNINLKMWGDECIASCYFMRLQPLKWIKFSIVVSKVLIGENN